MHTIDRITKLKPHAESRKKKSTWVGTSNAWDDRLWREDLFWEFVSQDDLNDSECFEEFMEKVNSSGLDDVSASVLWKKSIISIATKAWDEYWMRYY